MALNPSVGLKSSSGLREFALAFVIAPEASDARLNRRYESAHRDLLDFLEMMLDATASPVIIGAVGSVRSLASECEAGEKAAMACHHESRLFRAGIARALCVAAAAWTIWFASEDASRAGVMISFERASGGEIVAPPQSAPVSRAFLLIWERQQASRVLSTASNAGGASSSIPTSGTGAGLVALFNEAPTTAQHNLVSRLTLFSRTLLPPPLEDRFFRPPRV